MSATKNIRQQILSVLKTDFAKITVANGYGKTITNIVKGAIELKETNDTHILGYFFGEETRDDEINGLQKCNLPLVVYIEFKHTQDKENLIDTAEIYLKDLEMFFRRDTSKVNPTAVCIAFKIAQVIKFDIKSLAPVIEGGAGTVAMLINIQYVSSKTQNIF